MKKPKYLKDNDVVMFASPSNGIVEAKISNLEDSKEMFENHKLEVIEDLYVRSSNNGESAKAYLRAKELNKVLNDKSTSLIISVTGGDFLNEILDKIDFNAINENIKWFQGQSDTTLLLYVLTTKYDIQTIYSFNANTLSKASAKEFNNNLKILKGEEVIQNDFEYKIDSKNQIKSKWDFDNNVNVIGRIIGGCLSCLIDIIGTPYDNTINFIEKYENDGIIWYFDIDYMTNEEILRNIWHLEKCGWFKNTKCIIFGRVNEESYTGITLKDAIERGLNNKNIPVITNFDLGHSLPRITIVNGSLVNINCDGKNNFIKIIDED